MDSFETGEKVKLKSGGPEMTINNIYETGSIECQWFAGSKLQGGNFDPSSLERVEEDEDDDS